MSEKLKYSNPIVEYHRGIAVRKYNRVEIRVNSFEFKKFIDAKLDFRLTAREAIKQRKALCSLCDSGMKFITANTYR